MGSVAVDVMAVVTRSFPAAVVASVKLVGIAANVPVEDQYSERPLFVQRIFP